MTGEAVKDEDRSIKAEPFVQDMDTLTTFGDLATAIGLVHHPAPDISVREIIAGFRELLPRLCEVPSRLVGLLPRLADEDPPCARLAAEALSSITGLDVTAPAYAAPPPPAEPDGLPPLAEDDLDANLVPSPIDEVALPNAEAIARWWQAEAPRFPPDRRVLGGHPWTGGSVCAFLRSAPLRRRPPLALWLALSTRGALHLDPSALCTRQRAQLAHIERKVDGPDGLLPPEAAG